MTRPMTNTQRKRLLNRALRAGEAQAQTKVAALLNQRYNHLKREIRKGNLRKKLYKAQRDKKPDGSGVDWITWIALFTSGIKAALTPIIENCYEVEKQYWLSRGKTIQPLDVDAVIKAYEARVGRNFSEIGEHTHSDVLRDIIIWHATQETLPDLIDSMKQYFSDSRADNIARTDGVGLSSQVGMDTMRHLGITGFNVDLAPEENGYPCPYCIAQAAANPHALGDDMPPFHNYCRCGYSYVDNMLNAS